MYSVISGSDISYKSDQIGCCKTETDYNGYNGLGGQGQVLGEEAV